MVDRRPAAERAPGRPLFRELDRVRALVDVQGEDGEVVPAGSTGTVVAVWRGGLGFDVEFVRPVEALALCAPQALALVERIDE